MVSGKPFNIKCLQDKVYDIQECKYGILILNCKLKIGNQILERIGTDFTNKYFKFVGLKIDEFLNWDYQISNKIASSIFALNQIKNILPLNIRLLVYNALVRSHSEYGIITWGGEGRKKNYGKSNLCKKVQLEQ